MSATITLTSIDFAKAEAKARSAAEFMVSTLEHAIIQDIGEVYDEESERDEALVEFKKLLKRPSAFREAVELRVLEALSQVYVFLPPRK